MLRGEDLLLSTPRQIALYEALAEIGVGNGSTPLFGHLPYVMGEGNKKLSKRDPSRRCTCTASAASCPRACSTTSRCSAGRSAATARSSASRRWPRPSTSPTSTPTRPASTRRSARPSTRSRSAGWTRTTSPPASSIRLTAAGLLPETPTDEQLALVRAAAPARAGAHGRARRGGRHAGVPVRRRARSSSTPPPPRRSSGESVSTLDAALGALEDLDEWRHDEIENALREALVDGLGLKPRQAFGPVRVAVTGKTVSPPLFESIELLGRERTLERLRDALLDIRGY